MPEFNRNGFYMQPGYWGEHSNQDRCPFTRIETADLVSLIDRQQTGWFNQPDIIYATDILNQFFRLPNRERVVNLKPGQPFQGYIHVPGTVVYFEQEELLLSYRGRRINYIDPCWYNYFSCWGVVIRTDHPRPNSTYLIGTDIGFEYFDQEWIGNFKFLPYSPVPTVGEVVHTRVATTANIDAAETFERILNLRYWPRRQSL